MQNDKNYLGRFHGNRCQGRQKKLHEQSHTHILSHGSQKIEIYFFEFPCERNGSRHPLLNTLVKFDTKTILFLGKSKA